MSRLTKTLALLLLVGGLLLVLTAVASALASSDTPILGTFHRAGPGTLWGFGIIGVSLAFTGGAALLKKLTVARMHWEGWRW